ncbi:MAG: peptidyl-prolyl cis-trans isomerase [bacterium]
MKKKIFLIIIFLLGFMNCNSSPGIAMGSAIVATVGRKKITLDEFKQRLNNFAMENGIKPGSLSKDVVLANLDNLINTVVLLDEAQKEGITVTTDEIDAEYRQLKQGYTDEQFNRIFVEKLIDKKLWMEELAEHLLIKKLLASHFSNITVSEKDIKDYYDKHKNSFVVPEMVRPLEMELPSETVAQQAMEALNRGESFTKVAELYSISPGKGIGVDMGYLSARDLPEELAGILFTMPVGRVSGIIKTKFGYQIFLVEERIPAHQESLDEVRDEIINTLQADKRKEAFKTWLQSLREQAHVNVNYVLLKKAGLI